MSYGYVRITKVDTIRDIGIPLEEGYWIVGELIRPLEIGQPVIVHREMRNGVAVPGTFTTSLICEIEGYPTLDGAATIKTENSVYRIERVSRHHYFD